MIEVLSQDKRKQTKYNFFTFVRLESEPTTTFYCATMFHTTSWAFTMFIKASFFRHIFLNFH